MLTTPLKTDGVCIFPSTSLFVRVSGAAVEVVTTEGAMRIESDHPRFLFRNLLAGTLTEARAGMHIGHAPLGYTIETAIMGRRRTTIPVGKVVPDNVPLSKGTVLFETSAFCDYHPFHSIQIVGLKRNGRIIVGLADASYELAFDPELDARRIYHDELEGELLTNEGGHFTILTDGDYLPWPHGKRLHCQEIAEVQSRPESWGTAIEILTDLRDQPGQAAFRARVPPCIPPAGIDL
jgi:hypothetical protein